MHQLGNTQRGDKDIKAADMTQAATSAYDAIEAIINDLQVSDSEKNKLKLAVKHNLHRREQAIIRDINELQRRTTLAVPHLVGKQLKAAVDEQVVKYYNGNRHEFIHNIVAAFANVAKEQDVRQALEKELIHKEEQLLKLASERSEIYVDEMHQRYLCDSHNEFMHHVPYASTHIAGAAMTNWKRFWHNSHFAKGWKWNVEADQSQSNVDLAFGASVVEEQFAFNAKKLREKRQAAYPIVNRALADTVFNVVRGDLLSAVKPRTTKGKVFFGLLTYLNPLYYASSLLSDHIWSGIDTSQFVDEPRFEFDPKTNVGKVVMPTYYTWFPFNSKPYSYPMKCYKRMLQMRAADGYVPNIQTLPERHRKELVVWGLKNCLFSAEDIALPDDHPWVMAGNAERVKQSAKIGRAESIDYTLQRPDPKYKDVPVLPKPDPNAGKQADNALTIKAKTPANADPNNALQIRAGQNNPPPPRNDVAAVIRGQAQPNALTHSDDSSTLDDPGNDSDSDSSTDLDNDDTALEIRARYAPTTI